MFEVEVADGLLRQRITQGALQGNQSAPVKAVYTMAKDVIGPFMERVRQIFPQEEYLIETCPIGGGKANCTGTGFVDDVAHKDRTDDKQLCDLVKRINKVFDVYLQKIHAVQNRAKQVHVFKSMGPGAKTYARNVNQKATVFEGAVEKSTRYLGCQFSISLNTSEERALNRRMLKQVGLRLGRHLYVKRVNIIVFRLAFESSLAIGLGV